jgi:hypothetical protein
LEICGGTLEKSHAVGQKFYAAAEKSYGAAEKLYAAAGVGQVWVSVLPPRQK